MMLERMRIIDIACNWADDTHATYQTKLKQLFQFELSGVLLSLPFPLYNSVRRCVIFLAWGFCALPTCRSFFLPGSTLLALLH